MGKYFNVTVKPPVAVAALAAGNILDTEILFDWHGFDIPKGAAKLIGITVLYTGKNGVDYTPTDFELFWAKGNADKTGPITLGDDGAAVDTFGWFNNMQGKTYVDASQGNNDGDLITGNVLTVNSVTGGASGDNLIAQNNSIVLQGEPNSGTNVGFDKLYVAAIAKATHNWGASTMTLNTDHALGKTQIGVADLDALISVGAGDVLRDESGVLLGTVKNVVNATTINLEKPGLSALIANDQLIYNTTPITLVLSFEK